MRESKILRKCLIKNAERMREIDTPIRRYLAVRRRTPRCARKVAKSINGNNGSLVEWTYVERRSHMCQMMLDGMQYPAGGTTGERSVQKTANVCARGTITKPTEHQLDGRTFGQKICKLP